MNSFQSKRFLSEISQQEKNFSLLHDEFPDISNFSCKKTTSKISKKNSKRALKSKDLNLGRKRKIQKNLKINQHNLNPSYLRIRVRRYSLQQGILSNRNLNQSNNFRKKQFLKSNSRDKTQEKLFDQKILKMQKLSAKLKISRIRDPKRRNMFFSLKRVFGDFLTFK